MDNVSIIMSYKNCVVLSDTITVFDGYYDWKFTGIEDWQMYDTVSIIMDNNDTKSVKDDKIVCEQSSWLDLYNN